MDDETIFRILFIVAIISLAMLHQYSNFAERKAIDSMAEGNYSGLKMVKGTIVSMYETNNSYNIKLRTDSIVTIVALKNSFYSNLSLEQNDSIMVLSDFSDYYAMEDNAFFAQEIIKEN